MSTVQHGKDLEIRGEPRYEITEENAESTSTQQVGYTPVRRLNSLRIGCSPIRQSFFPVLATSHRLFGELKTKKGTHYGHPLFSASWPLHVYL